VKIHHQFSLQPYNTLAVDVNAARFCTVDSALQLQQLLASEQSAPLLVLGGGSNLVLTGDFDGLVIHNRISGVQLLEETADQVLIRVGAGENWDRLVQFSVQQGWYGLQNLSWIPGSVGAAPIQNIGAYGVELKDVLHAVETLRVADGAVQRFSNAECEFGYRESIFKQQEKDCHVITYVELCLSKRAELKLDYGEILRSAEDWGYDVASLTPTDVRAIIIRIRSLKLPDPAQLPNVGSFFKNPLVSREHYERLHALEPDMVAYPQPDGSVKLAAGWLIDRLQWKGKQMGTARVHDRQALVLVNMGDSSRDVLALAHAIQNDVQRHWSIDLEIEPRVI